MNSISLITPYYNADHEKFKRLAESVRKNTCQDYEWIIVVDGCNFDEDLSSDINYRIVTLGNNYGMSVARNVGFQVSVGDFICYADTDDVITKFKFNNILTKLQNADILFSRYVIISGSHMYTIRIHTPESIKDIKYYNISVPLGVAHRRKPFVLCGGFQPGIVCGEDGILWRRMLDLPNIRVVIENDIAGYYHVNNQGQSRTQRRFKFGGFAFDANDLEGSNGQYLDKDWFENFSSKGLYENEGK